MAWDVIREVRGWLKQASPSLRTLVTVDYGHAKNGGVESQIDILRSNGASDQRPVAEIYRERDAHVPPTKRWRRRYTTEFDTLEGPAIRLRQSSNALDVSELYVRDRDSKRLSSSHSSFPKFPMESMK